jgi:hydroxymethylbilane synthase
MVVTRSENLELQELLSKINHPEAALCVKIERDFLRTLQGGCSAPIGAYAYKNNKTIHFLGDISHPNGNPSVSIKKTSENMSPNLGVSYAKEILSKGGLAILEAVK